MPAWAGCLMILGLYPASSQAEPTTGRANTPDLIASCAHFTRAVARFGSQPTPIGDSLIRQFEIKVRIKGLQPDKFFRKQAEHQDLIEEQFVNQRSRPAA